jgi:hypothetical protein
MRLPKLIKLISECWKEAEESTCVLLATRYQDKNEPFITDLFHGELGVAVKEASDKGSLRRAFLEDMQNAFPELCHSAELDLRISKFGATVAFHSGEIETRTKGDLGLVLIRPDAQKAQYETNSIIIDADYQRGLLCQAKINQRSSRPRQRPHWGKLSDSQQNELPHHFDYLALLLYRYLDIERLSLGPFQWQTCRRSSIPEIKRWLRRGDFPSLKSSNEIITKLGNDQGPDGIGTDKKDIIKKYICPETRPSLTIRIGWPPDGKPPSRILIRTQTQDKEKVVLVRRL